MTDTTTDELSKGFNHLVSMMRDKKQKELAMLLTLNEKLRKAEPLNADESYEVGFLVRQAIKEAHAIQIGRAHV